LSRFSITKKPKNFKLLSTYSLLAFST
jgi:hypothetical protein